MYTMYTSMPSYKQCILNSDVMYAYICSDYSKVEKHAVVKGIPCIGLHWGIYIVNKINGLKFEN